MRKLILIWIFVFLLLINLSIIYAAPNYFDLRNKDKDGKDWMTPVKHQGWTCGSCWAHAAVGVFEAQYNIDTKNYNINLDLSEQDLVSDCFDNAYPYVDCRGGSAQQAFAHIKSKGITDEECFPYEDWTCGPVSPYSETCSAISCTYHSDASCSDFTCDDRCSNHLENLYFIKGYDDLKTSDIDEIKDYVLKGPITATINYDGMNKSDDGIYRCENDKPDLHNVIITGYNDTGNSSTSYWIVKNSYGSDWPDGTGDGYLKMGFDECSIQWPLFRITNVTTMNLIDTKELTILNTGTQDLTITDINPNVRWVTSISENSFIISSSSSKKINITVDNTGLNYGRHEGKITIYSDAGNDKEFEVPLVLYYKKPGSYAGAMIYNFTESGTHTEYLRIPKNATIINASLSIMEVF